MNDEPLTHEKAMKTTYIPPRTEMVTLQLDSHLLEGSITAGTNAAESATDIIFESRTGGWSSENWSESDE